VAHRKTLLWLLPLLIIAGILIIPWPASLILTTPAHSIAITDRNGALLYEQRKLDSGSRNPIALKEIPEPFIDALLAVEDRTFYTHPGVSARGIARALWQNLVTGSIVSGGSTITQQLVRSGSTGKRTVISKIREAFLALKLEQMLTKNEILERYINTVAFGHEAYGIQSAAQTFFDKDPRELSLAECAFLAGLPQSPVSFDPFQHMDRAKARQRLVLTALQDTGALSEKEQTDAFAEPLTLARDSTAIRAPHFVMWLQDQHPEIRDATEPIRTTIDLTLQTETEQIIARQLQKLQDKNVTSAAVVVLDAHTGEILTMIGSADFYNREDDGQVNVAVTARQPGSALKPFTYALALASGDTAATTVADTEVQFFTQEGNPYTPRNYDYDTHGLVRYREALANSYNIAAVKVVEKVGVPKLLNFLKSAGIATLNQTPEFYGLALTLGDGEVRLLELAKAYGIFARGGTTLETRSLMNEKPVPGVKILDPKVAWIIADILSDPQARLPQFGDSGPLNFNRTVAAKTGTTRNSRDNWTMGFTPDVIVGVWVGNADNSPMKDTSGVTGAGPIFHDVMVAATRHQIPAAFAQPPGMIRKQICILSGKLPTPICGGTMQEWFIAGTEPKEQDDIFRTVKIDTRNGFLSNNNCIQSFVLEKAYATFPKDADQWAKEHGYSPPPTLVSPLCGNNSTSSATGNMPPAIRYPLSATSDPDHAGSPSTPLRTGIPRSDKYLEIISPRNGDSFLLDPLVPAANQKIILEAHASPGIESIRWSVNGKDLGEGNGPTFRQTWNPAPGTYTFVATSGNLQSTVKIEIRKMSEP